MEIYVPERRASELDGKWTLIATTISLCTSELPTLSHTQ